MVSTKFAPLVLGAVLVASDASAARVDPAVHRTLRQQGTVNLLVTMKKGTRDLLNSIKEASFTSRGALIDDMVNRLQDYAAESQSEVNPLFAKEATGEYTKSTSFWITNQIYIEGTTMSFLQRLAAMPTVAEISEEDIYTIPDVPSTPINAIRSLASAADVSTEWGLDKIQAPAVWATGNTGEGVIVGGLDTGVLATPETLKNNFERAARHQNSPAEYLNVIAVGATDAADALAEFSSKGPTAAGRVKPEITAPGHNVRSAWFTGDNEYKYMSGTSMATPHVSGAIALMLAAKPGLKFDEVRDLLINNVDTAQLQPSNFSCANTVDSVFPNNMYGYGRLNVFKAIQSLNQNATEPPVED
ncbi:hypothetical protein Poli38472_010595 [Pythium oligandrum]|uniref:subtilisin n=1 Tax=Pythium oligandrum TaxID=41045 RepID=A0A8K1C3E0_PYTOL|nr:hypothetical protein Poli38472_010595 [Pythium oligandrum]|eukprot:TMW55713.1 hypothetical protein Poli38472_010595 [Pythium oligandrum]